MLFVSFAHEVAYQSPMNQALMVATQELSSRRRSSGYAYMLLLLQGGNP